MSDAARGRLTANGVRVEEVAQANRLHNKGQVGTPLSGNTLALAPAEAAWAIATGRLEVDGVEGLAGFLRLWPGTEVAYLAYSDLRSRGLTVREPGHDASGAMGAAHTPAADAGPVAGANGAAVRFHVMPRGSGLKGEAGYVVECHAEREAVRWADLLAWARDAVTVAVVDEDGDVTHYAATEAHPQGDVPPGRLPVGTGEILQDRVAVEGPPGEAYRSSELLGTRHDGRMLLSFLEAEHLRRRGVLQVAADLPHHAARRQPHFGAALPVFEALRSAGVVARSGLKFGTHLRGYRGDPDAGHALWLVECVAADATLAWSALSRGVRLAHGVRKAYLVAGPSTDGVRFVQLTWARP